MPGVLSTARGRRPRVVLKAEGTVFPYTDRPKPVNNNRLLTEREGQYSPVRPEQARLVSGLLYGTVSDSKMQWHSVSDSKMQLQKRFVTESDKSSS